MRGGKHLSRWICRSAGLWGPIGFITASLIAAPRQAGYSHVRQPISGLAARHMKSAPVMVAGFGALGAAGLVMEVDDPVVTTVLRIAGVSTLVAGAVPCSTAACPSPFIDANVELTDFGHAAASMVAFLCWLGLPVLGAQRAGPTWYRQASATLAVLAAGTYGLGIITTQRRSALQGLVQRAFLAPVFAWYAATSARALTGDGPTLTRRRRRRS